MIQIKDLCIKQGDFKLDGVNLNINKGEYVVLMGKTGSGKTTVLEAICGLRPILSGTLIIGERDITRLKPAERMIGYVPQDGALFDTMTIRENIGFALKIRKWDRKTAGRRVEELADCLGIADLLNRTTAGLSGGEKQRIAIARALSFYPEVLCLDEPLSALDEPTRLEMYDVIKTLKRDFKMTALHISHSSYEAEMLADRVVTIENGSLINTSSAFSFSPR